MKNIIFSLIAICIGSISNAQFKANVEVVVQTQTNWCWAANSECILKYYGKPTTQCEINDYSWSKSNCCTSPSSCNKTNKIVGKTAIEGIIDHFGQLKSTFVTGGLTTTQLEEVLSEKRPFVVACAWNSGGGHVVVGCGYDPSGGTITMMDPWKNNGMTTSKYSQTTVKLNSGSGTWKKSLIVDNPINVGVNKVIHETNIKIYPSPGNGIFNLELVGFKEPSINVFNLLGELILSEKWKPSNSEAGKFQIDISNAPKGNYIVSIKSSEKAANKMIVKK